MATGMTNINGITRPDRGEMKVYVARDYIDDKYRKTNKVQVNLPEYLPTVPMDDQFTETVVEQGYFVNTNYPVTQEVIRSVHCLDLPIEKGSYAPIRMRKGTEFMLLYATGKIEEGTLIFIRHKEDIELEEEELKNAAGHKNT